MSQPSEKRGQWSHPAIESSQATAKSALLTSTNAQAHSVKSRFSPWLISFAYPLSRYVMLPLYFRRIEVFGQEHLPRTGPVILAPTHRSRWDAFMVPYAAGHDVTGRHLRFMVTIDEVKGIQGWFIDRLGGFPIDTKRPGIGSLRHGIEILESGETLVLFPEGGYLQQNRACPLNQLHSGLARLALQAETLKPNLGIQIVPMNIYYSKPTVPWRSSVRIRIGEPLKVAEYSTASPKQSAKQLTAALDAALKSLNDPQFLQSLKKG